MLRRTEAIVLKTSPFSEADLIVTFLTLDYGLVKAFAKSPRKIKSRFGSSLEPLTYSRISFWGREDANLPRLTQSDIIKPFQSIREKIECFLRVTEIMELTLSLLPEREANRNIFNLLMAVLDRIEKEIGGGNKFPPLAKGGEGGFGGNYRDSGSGILDCIFYKIRFLDMAGYGPRLDGCARCGKSGYNFYISHGSIICEVCAGGVDAPMRLSPGVIKLYETLKRWDLAKLDRIKVSEELFAELSGMLDGHILHTIAKPLKTKSFQHRA